MSLERSLPKSEVTYLYWPKELCRLKCMIYFIVEAKQCRAKGRTVLSHLGVVEGFRVTGPTGTGFELLFNIVTIELPITTNHQTLDIEEYGARILEATAPVGKVSLDTNRTLSAYETFH